MPRRRFIFDPPERFVTGTIGEPGQRTFFLQARDGGRVVSVALEKVQVAVLADRLGQLLGELDKRGIAPEEPLDPDVEDTSPLDEPLNEAFRAGALTLGWDGDAELDPRRGARGVGGRRAHRPGRGRRRGRGRPRPVARADDRGRGPELRRTRGPHRGLRASAVPPVRPAARSDGPSLPAPQRPLRQLTSPRMPDPLTALRILREGEIEIVGRIVGSSNNAMLATVSVPCPDPEPDESIHAVYKPTLGERPLDDFPDGTLSRREVAAWHVSEALGWGIVPPTVLREGPFGEGMVQQYVELDLTVDVVEMIVSDDPRLRRIAAFDAAVNNTDRKGGHLLPVDGGAHVFGVDHGVCFSPMPKLRTVLWGWRGDPFDDDELAGFDRLCDALTGELGVTLRGLLTPTEVEATRRRVEGLLASRRWPMPSPHWPAVPWPPF